MTLMSKSGEINSGEGLNNDLEVTSFTFGSDNLELMGDYYALRLINERFARMVRGIFLPMLRLQPKINPFPPEVKTFDEYTSGIESFMSLSTLSILIAPSDTALAAEDGLRRP